MEGLFDLWKGNDTMNIEDFSGISMQVCAQMSKFHLVYPALIHSSLLWSFAVPVGY
jgi:hypothetical protein